MNTPYILMVAPHAPPKNTAEALQVGRLLQALAGNARGHVVSAEAAGGWAMNDDSLPPLPARFTARALRLPFHSHASRLLSSNRLAFLHQPDALFWLAFCARSVMRQLPHMPDVIYSRSGPMSGALLAQRLKRHFKKPWIMHLSDPWADSPKAPATARAQAAEARCFADADAVSLTTEGQAHFYRQKYPAHAHKIFVSPNMMPALSSAMQASPKTSDAPLHIVYAGNLYGDRSPETLVQALELLQQKSPALLQHICIDMYGNIQPSAREWLQKMPSIIRCHGAVSFQTAQQAQQDADIILSIELLNAHPLNATFLPSKILDAMALGKPLLALTPAASETATLCAAGYGWAVPPGDSHTIAAQLEALINARATIRATAPKAAPKRYEAAYVVEDLWMQLNRLGVKVPS